MKHFSIDLKRRAYHYSLETCNHVVMMHKGQKSKLVKDLAVLGYVVPVNPVVQDIMFITDMAQDGLAEKKGTTLAQDSRAKLSQEGVALRCLKVN